MHPGSRATPTGDLLRWRTAGVERVLAAPALPLVIEWGEGTRHPGLGATAVTIERVELAVDEYELRAWLGEHDLPIAVGPGPSAVERVVIATPDGTIALA